MNSVNPAAGEANPAVIRIICNGEERETTSGQSVAAFITALGLKPEMVAVELEGRVLPLADYDHTILHAGVRLELIRFVGGG